MSSPSQRLVVGIAGSSGPQYGIGLLRLLRQVRSVETHLALSSGATRTLDRKNASKPHSSAARAAASTS